MTPDIWQRNSLGAGSCLPGSSDCSVTGAEGLCYSWMESVLSVPFSQLKPVLLTLGFIHSFKMDYFQIHYLVCISSFGPT